jgi:hypothetical protein
LISRHVDLAEQEGEEAQDFLSCHIYNQGKDAEGGGGRRTVYPNDDCVQRGIYTTNPHVLLRHEVTTDSWDLNLVMSQYKKKNDITFSVSVFSTETFALSECAPVLPSKVVLNGAWTEQTAGGSCGRGAEFYTNPQYSLNVHSGGALLELLLKTNKELAVNVTVVNHEGGKRVESIGKENEVLTSGSYRSGVAFTSNVSKSKLRLLPGSYTIVVSTYNSGEIGPYLLEVRSDASCINGSQALKDGITVKELAPEGHDVGFHILQEGIFVAGANAAGCGNFNNYEKNPIYVLKYTGKSKYVTIYGRIRVKGGSGGVAINATVYTSISDGGAISAHSSPVGKDCGLIVTTNDGVYSSSSSGQRIPKFVLKRGQVFSVVISTFEPSEGGPGVGWKLSLYGSEAFEVVKNNCMSISRWLLKLTHLGFVSIFLPNKAAFEHLPLELSFFVVVHLSALFNLFSEKHLLEGEQRFLLRQLEGSKKSNYCALLNSIKSRGVVIVDM